MMLKNGMIIECNSEQEAKEFIKEAYKQGFKWVSHQDGDENLTYWFASVMFKAKSRIYYILGDDDITWSSIYKHNAIRYSDLIKGENKAMTKSDLKNGMVVELKNGYRGLILDNRMVFKDGFNNLCSYKDDLYLQNRYNSEFDIIKVFKIKNPIGIDKLFNDEYLELIWEQEEEKEEIKVGDIVKVIDYGLFFDEYYDWVEENIKNRELKLKFDYGNILPNETICTVLYIDKHNYGCNADNTLAYIKDIKNNRCYLINIEGLEKID